MENGQRQDAGRGDHDGSGQRPGEGQRDCAGQTQQAEQQHVHVAGSGRALPGEGLDHRAEPEQPGDDHDRPRMARATIRLDPCPAARRDAHALILAACGHPWRPSQELVDRQKSADRPRKMARQRDDSRGPGP